MTCKESEALSQRICNLYYDFANKSVKTTVNYFKMQNVLQSTRYHLLKEYLQYENSKDPSRSGRSLKFSKKNLNNIVKSINNRCDLTQRQIA